MKVPTKRQGKKRGHSVIVDILKRQGLMTLQVKGPPEGIIGTGHKQKYRLL